MKYLVTGSAGFIGSHLAEYLKNAGNEVWGVDNFSPYYSVELKEKRVQHLLNRSGVNFIYCDLTNLSDLKKTIEMVEPDIVIHLAAQAGVRLPISSASKYFDANIIAFFNVFSAVQGSSVKSVLYASSSSVYGDSAPVPFSESWKDLDPKSFYAATKLANEAMAPVFARELGIRVRGLRFFTVYGEWGRPDMAYFRIGTSAALKYPFTLFGDGSIQRDFTYVKDVVRITSLLADEMQSRPYGFSDVVNIGGGRPLSMNHLFEVFDNHFQTEVEIRRTEEFRMDSRKTMASTEYLESLIGKQEFTTLEVGIEKFAQWLTNVEITTNLIRWVESTN